MNTSPTDALALLERHHVQLEELFADVFDAEDAEPRGWAVQNAVDHLIGLIEAEDKVLLARLPHGDEVVRQAMQHHRGIRTRVVELLALAPVDDEVVPRCQALHLAMQEHHRFEQQAFFPYVMRQLEPSVRERLGAALADRMVRLHAGGAPRRALQLRAALQAEAGFGATRRSQHVLLDKPSRDSMQSFFCGPWQS